MVNPVESSKPFNEQPLSFMAGDQQLSAILHPGADNCLTALLVVVGGPQYRVGSHRQFVHLARYLSAQGITVMRFDTTGMGDSGGDKKPFDQLDQDIQASIDALFAAQPALERVVLWGLCDGASAALIYAPQDIRVGGLVLVNPWLENDRAQAQTRLWDYYLKRLLNPGFWQKLLRGGVAIRESMSELGETVGQLASAEGAATDDQRSYQQRMLSGFERFQAPLCWLLSGNDLTAAEFERQYRTDNHWLRIASRKSCSIKHLEQADHTFSTAAWKQWLAEQTLIFIRSL